MDVKLFEDKEKKVIREDLFTEIAENLVKSFREEKTDNGFKKKKGKGTTRSQLRKFYNHVLSIKKRIDYKMDSDPEVFKKELPYIKMLKARVEYAYRKRDAKVNENFFNFINTYVDVIKDYRDFEVFCYLFEAIVAYSQKYLRN